MKRIDALMNFACRWQWAIGLCALFVALIPPFDLFAYTMGIINLAYYFGRILK